MKVKVLKIRISDQFQNMDEAVLNDYLERYEIIDLHTQMIQGDINYWSVFINFEDKERKVNLTKANVVSVEELTTEELIVYEKLKNWRAEKARETQQPPYIIFHNAHLVSIAKSKPANFEALEKVKGLGKQRIEKFGAEIIEVLEST